MVTPLPRGKYRPLLRRAASMRCWLSFTALSGRPTRKKNAPFSTFTSAVTIVALMPNTALPKTLMSIPSLVLFSAPGEGQIAFDVVDESVDHLDVHLLD